MGIDIGTTNSAASALIDGEFRMVPSAEGLAAHSKMFPSIVSFMEDGRIVVGGKAKKRLLTHPDRTITAIKRKIGTDYSVKIGERRYTPQEITSMILRKIKRDTEAFLREEISEAVITVPSYFNDNQRTATRDAALVAGIDVVRMINEPTAASLAYGLDKIAEDLNIVVLDFGGGTFDTTILEMRKDVFKVLSTCGDTQLGGYDMDEKIVEYLLHVIKKEEGIDLSDNMGARVKLRVAAEEAKISLSTSMSAPISLSLSSDGSDLQLNTVLTRSKLEDLVAEIVQRLEGPMESALAGSDLEAQDVDKVILVGGPTKMPIIQRKFREYFGKDFERGIAPMECVAIGAAVQASVLRDEIEDLVLLDVTPLSLGIETSGAVFAPLIERNTTIPTEASKVFTTAQDFQTVMPIHVLQGERPMAADNVSLGVYNLEGIELAPRHEPLVEVRFSIDANGILNVKAEDLGTGEELNVDIVGTTKLSSNEMNRMIREAAVFADSDEKKKEKIETRNRAKALLYEVKRILEGEEIPTNQKMGVERALVNLREYVQKDDIPKIKAQVEGLTELTDKLAVRDRACKKANALISLTEKMTKKISGEEKEEIEKLVQGLRYSLQMGDVEKIKKGTDELAETFDLLWLEKREIAPFGVGVEEFD